MNEFYYKIKIKGYQKLQNREVYKENNEIEVSNIKRNFKKKLFYFLNLSIKLFCLIISLFINYNNFFVNKNNSSLTNYNKSYITKNYSSFINLNTFSASKTFAEQNFYSNEKIIPIVYAPNDQIINPTLVSFTSLIYNAEKGTKYDIYFFVPMNFSEISQKKIYSIWEKKKKNISITFKYFEKTDFSFMVGHHGCFCEPMFYRLYMPYILTNYKRAIYLDCDTLILKDLTPMYNLEMSENYYLGLWEVIAGSNFSGRHIDINYINNGVLLMDLESLRKNNSLQLFINYAHDLVDHPRNYTWPMCEQDMMNFIYNKKIGVFHPKYSIRHYMYFNLPIDNSAKTHKYQYSLEEMAQARKDPFILHYYIHNKFEININWSRLWWNKYAKMTGYYDSICEWSINECDRIKDESID